MFILLKFASKKSLICMALVTQTNDARRSIKYLASDFLNQLSYTSAQ